MPSLSRRILWLIPVFLLAAVPLVILFREVPKPRPQRHVVSKAPALSPLAEVLNWSALEVFQDTITRLEFERLLSDVFTAGTKWRESIAIAETEAVIGTGDPATPFRLRFALPGTKPSPPRPWRTAAQLPPAPTDKPLADLRIALDPGHLGGVWAQMEERWFSVAGGPPVCEGDMTLLVARLLKPQLEAMGATVTLVRETTEPVTHLRPDALRDPTAQGDSVATQRTAERLFYRTAEIRARADLVNDTLQPDLVVCLHFNAEAWGDPANPTLIDRHHLHLILNGAYADGEIMLADQRFALLRKLLQRTHEEEVLVGTTVADTFASLSGLPPYVYPPDATNVRAAPESPYLWNRNLLANRLYNCPVIFMEPYVMNSTLDHPRLVAGDFAGLREIAGKMQTSIFREYAGAVAAGLAKHYTGARLPGVPSGER